MGRQELSQPTSSNSFLKTKFISKHQGTNSSPHHFPQDQTQQTTTLHKFRQGQQPKQLQDENRQSARKKAPNVQRKPFLDITNQKMSSSQLSSSKKALKTADSSPNSETNNSSSSSSPCQPSNSILPEENNDQQKYTKHYTFLTYMDNTALKQFKVCLFVDRELEIPSEYALKLQDHTIDNDVATDDEQIQSATRKLRTALEEEVFMQRELEGHTLESVMFQEVEKYEKEIKKQPIEQLFDKIFMAYQSTASKPFKLKAHERLLYKTIEKSAHKYREAFKNNTQHYQTFLQRQKKLLKKMEKSHQEELFPSSQQLNQDSSQYEKINSSDDLLDSL